MAGSSICRDVPRLRLGSFMGVFSVFLSVARKVRIRRRRALQPMEYGMSEV